MAEYLLPDVTPLGDGAHVTHYIARLVTLSGKERWRCQHKHHSPGAAEYCAGRAARKREIARQQGYTTR